MKVTINLPEKLVKKIDKDADKEDRSRSYIIAKILEKIYGKN